MNQFVALMYHGLREHPKGEYSVALSEFEKARIAERVKAGLARARAQGKKLGRPRLSTTVSVPRGLTVRGAAEAWGVSKSTAANWLNAGRVPTVGQTPPTRV